MCGSQNLASNSSFATYKPHDFIYLFFILFILRERERFSLLVEWTWKQQGLGSVVFSRAMFVDTDKVRGGGLATLNPL